MNRRLIIEFVGTPGAGKTTVARQLAEDVTDGTRLTPSGAGWRFVSQHPVLSARWILRAVRVDASSALSRHGIKLALHCARQQVAVRSAWEGILVFHEGCITAARRIQHEHGCPLSQQLLAGLLPVSDAVVVLEVSREVAYQRLLERDMHSRAVAASADGESWQSLVLAVESVVSALPPEVLVRLKAEEPVPALVAATNAALREVTAHRSVRR